ncbi:amylo-alpha-1,6-glucosidase [Deferribacterales bacterium RsTz2092]|nr:glycogen debranching protein [Deferribacterales bacterium]
MRFCFDKVACQNIRKSLRKEWLETNGSGDYASSSLICCNTRKYHGLLVAGAGLENRHVLLSSLDESVLVDNKEMFFSSHRYPDGVQHPVGHEYISAMETGVWTIFKYMFGDLKIVKEVMMVPGKRAVIISYHIHCSSDMPKAHLRIKPMTAFRHFHALTHENDVINKKTTPIPSGYKLNAYKGVPQLCLQLFGDNNTVVGKKQYWYKNVEYIVEAERGFDSREDLFMPGEFEIELVPNKKVYLFASTEPFDEMFPEKNATIEKVWFTELSRRELLAKDADTLEGHLALEGEKFIIRQLNGDPAVVAGYHWFGVWGRDMYLSLPGLTFCAGRVAVGAHILQTATRYIKDGLIPNMYSSDGNSHAYNSADASLTYIWAISKMLVADPSSKSFVKKELWSVIKDIIAAYSNGSVPFAFVDASGLLHVGDENTQLTWMDASVNGVPVTPRHGCPVEINALWFNALAFANELAVEFKDKTWEKPDLEAIQNEFFKRFWVSDPQGGYLADVWRDGWRDMSLRPNQIFAMSMPYPILEEKYHKEAIARVRHYLLTPFGLRTLAPGSYGYRASYAGGPAERDGAYHQGTVWTWLLSHYAEALLRCHKGDDGVAAGKLLRTIKPLFTQHLADAGVGSISEIFAGDPPHQADGTIAQAWSVAGCLRMLQLVNEYEPDVYAEWVNSLDLGKYESTQLFGEVQRGGNKGSSSVRTKKG